MPPHQLVNGILSTAVAEEFDELFIGRVDHFGDCLLTRVKYSAELDHSTGRILAAIRQGLQVCVARALISFW